MVQIHPVDRLFEKMKAVEPYPSGVVPLRGRIPGLAFFPGGYGLWGKGIHQDPPFFPVGGVMVIAHNFDCETGFNRSLEAKSERATSPTWGPLTKVLIEAGISLESCFFTNAYMGLKAGDKPQGVFPGSWDHQFVERCASFLLQQIQEQRPKLILVLGLQSIPVLASMSPDLEAWRRVDSLDALYRLDRQGKSPIASIRFTEVEHAVRIVLLIHPCNRHMNAKGRFYQAVEGPGAEVALLQDLLGTMAS